MVNIVNHDNNIKKKHEKRFWDERELKNFQFTLKSDSMAVSLGYKRTIVRVV